MHPRPGIRVLAAGSTGLLLAAGVTVTLAAAPAGATASRRVAPASATVVARDTFARSVRSGLGRASVGGTYLMDRHSSQLVHVARPAGALVRLGHTVVSAWLPAARSRDTSVVSGAVLTAVGGGHQVSDAVDARTQPDRSRYTAVAVVSDTGRTRIRIDRVRPNGKHQLATAAVPGSIAAGQQLRVQLEVSGTRHVALAARAWVQGQAVPDWQVRATDSSALRIAASGGVGLRFAQAAGRANTVRVRSLDAWRLEPPRRPRDPGKPTTGAPSSSAPSSSAPSSSAPSSTAPSSSAPSSSAPSSTAPSSTAPSSSAPSSSAPSSTASTTAAPTSSAPTSGGPTSGPGSTPPPGSAPLGSTSYPVPAGALFVSSSTGDDTNSGTLNAPLRTVKTALRKAAPGQTIVLRAGIYRESLFVSTPNLTIESYPGETVWFDGSVPVGGWQRTGSTWTAPWSTQFWNAIPSNYLIPGYPMAGWPDMTFVDAAPLAQVAAGSAISAGSFAVDYNAHTLQIGVDPTQHLVEASTLSRAFTVSAPNFTLRGVGLRRYADSAQGGQAGVIYVARPNAVFQNDVIQDAALEGLATSKADGVVLDHLTVLRAGMLGLGAYRTSGVTISNCLIDQSNAEHFNKSPSSGGMKIVWSTDILIKNNVVVNGNDTHGIWFDISSKRFTVVGNTLYNNGRAPNIEAELSAFGVIAGNTMTGGDEGVFIYNTNDVRIFNNTMSGDGLGSVYVMQDARRAAPSGYPDPTCPWIVSNLVVSNNVIGWNGGPYGLQFYALDNATNIGASQMNITLDGNLFHARSGSTDSMVAWGASDNHTLTHYDDPASLDSGLGMSWVNAQGAPSQATALEASVAKPLPADIAAALGVPAGVRHLGAF